MLPLIAAMLLGQTVTPVKIVNPNNQSKAATTTTFGAKETLDINCVNGCGGAGGGSGGPTTWADGGSGRLIADEGVGPDGGVFAVFVVNQPAIQPVSAAALPLPAGAATEATLATLLSSGTFTARLGALGQKAMAGSAPVVFASDQSPLGVTGTFWQAVQPVSGTFWQATQPVSGPLTDAQLRALAVAISAVSLPLPTGASTETTLATMLTSSNFALRLGTLGQKTMSGSTPVVIASDQPAIPTSVSSLPLPAGAATEATMLTRTKPADQQHAIVDSSALPTGAATETTLALIKAKTDNLDVALSTRTKPADTQPISAASLPLPTGAATETTLATRLAEATFVARFSLLGQTTMALSAPVVIASNQTPVPVSGAYQTTQPVSLPDGGTPASDDTETVNGRNIETIRRLLEQILEQQQAQTQIQSNLH